MLMLDRQRRRDGYNRGWGSGLRSARGYHCFPTVLLRLYRAKLLRVRGCVGSGFADRSITAGEYRHAGKNDDYPHCILADGTTCSSKI